MGLPTSRDETLTSGSKLRPALINKMEDCITVLNGQATSLDGRVTVLEAAVVSPPGAATVVYPPSDIVESVNPGGAPTIGFFAGSSTGGGAGPPRVDLSGSNVVCACPLRLEVGRTITAWSIAINKGSNATVTLHAELLDGVGAAVTRIGSLESNGTNAPGLIALGPSSAISAVVQAGHCYSIAFWQSGGGYDVVYQYQVTVS